MEIPCISHSTFTLLNNNHQKQKCEGIFSVRNKNKKGKIVACKKKREMKKIPHLKHGIFIYFKKQN